MSERMTGPAISSSRDHASYLAAVAAECIWDPGNPRRYQTPTTYSSQQRVDRDDGAGCLGAVQYTSAAMPRGPETPAGPHCLPD